jgi:hypothetical protein
MPTSLFQTDQFRIQFRTIPTQYQTFYQKIERSIQILMQAIATKSDTIPNIRGELVKLRRSITLQWTDAQGNPINL